MRQSDASLCAKLALSIIYSQEGKELSLQSLGLKAQILSNLISPQEGTIDLVEELNFIILEKINVLFGSVSLSLATTSNHSGEICYSLLEPTETSNGELKIDAFLLTIVDRSYMQNEKLIMVAAILYYQQDRTCGKLQLVTYYNILFSALSGNSSRAYLDDLWKSLKQGSASQNIILIENDFFTVKYDQFDQVSLLIQPNYIFKGKTLLKISDFVLKLAFASKGEASIAKDDIVEIEILRPVDFIKAAAIRDVYAVSLLVAAILSFTNEEETGLKAVTKRYRQIHSKFLRTKGNKGSLKEHSSPRLPDFDHPVLKNGATLLISLSGCCEICINAKISTGCGFKCKIFSIAQIEDVEDAQQVDENIIQFAESLTFQPKRHSDLEEFELFDKEIQPIDPIKVRLQLKEYYDTHIYPFLIKDRSLMLAALQRILDKAFPKYGVVKLFGSSVNNLGFESSDADVCIIPFTWDTNKKSSMNIFKVESMLRKAGMHQVTVISHARVPIVKCYYKLFDCWLDINVGHSLGVYNSALLCEFTRLDSRVKPLIMLIKKWAKVRAVNDPSSNTLSSYAYSLMAIGYMQHVGLLASLQIGLEDCEVISVPEITTTKLKKLRMRNVNISFHQSSSTNICDVWGAGGAGDLFLFFMEYFGNTYKFNSSNQISVYHGGIGEFDALKGNRKLVVVDPFERDRNCTSGASDAGLGVVRREFRRVLHVLSMSGSIDQVFDIFGK